MKIQIVSDLHVEFEPIPSFPINGDVLVVAGDTHVQPAAVREIISRLALRVPVVTVLGNHEFDRKRFPSVLETYRAALTGIPDVYFLENESIELMGVRFYGTMLWTDMLGGAEAHEIARLIEYFRWRDVRTEDLLALHHRAVAWLADNVVRDGRSVIVTHMAPSFKSQHPRFAGKPLGGFFASNLDALIEELRVPLWVHGHMHDWTDYRIGPTRVVCNPRGYPGENPTWFGDAAVVELKPERTAAPGEESADQARQSL